MFDQAFSSRNFRRIFDLENRKGRYLEDLFFPEVAALTERARTLAREIRQCRSALEKLGVSPAESAELSDLYDQKRELRRQKEETRAQALEDVSSQVAANDFTIGIRLGGVVHGKPIYTTNATASAYFCVKQIQRNISTLYKVRQSNRHFIVGQLRTFLSDRFPKYVLRTDVSEFYESIPRSDLLKQLAADSLLTPASTRLLNKLLWEYKDLSKTSAGIPRGIGVSAYLAELYMRRFDERVRELPGLVYYARYVDDIVMIYVPEPGRDATVLEERVEEVFTKYGLDKNLAKTERIEVDGASQKRLEYLGYKFAFGNGSIEIGLTAKKLSRYKNRIDAAVARYLACPPEREPRARKLLMNRLRYLTGNTRLVNNKRHARVGIYYSNSMLTGSTSLHGLDKYLTHVATRIPQDRSRVREQVPLCQHE